MLSSYQVWKWRVLGKRRAFMFPIISAILSIAWGAIYYDVKGLASPTKNKYGILLNGVPLYFLFCQVILTIITVLSKWGRKSIYDTQGRRFCDWSSFSLGVCLFYFEIPFMLDEAGGLSDNDRTALFSILPAVGIALFHHVGLTQTRSSWFVLFTIISWAVLTHFRVKLSWEFKIKIYCLIIITPSFNFFQAL